MRTVSNVIFIIVIPFFLNGCFGFFEEEKINVSDLKEQQLKNIERQGLTLSKFEKELIRVATKTEENFFNYQAILKQRKGIEKEKVDNHIPKNFGKKITTFFTGKSGILLKQLADRVDYKLLTHDIELTDTKNISKNWRNSSINDIIEELAVGYGFNIVINEKEQIIYIKAEE